MTPPLLSRSDTRPGAGLILALAVALALAVCGTAQAASVIVQPGETLSAIAARAQVSVSAMASANGIDKPNHVRAGQTLNLPGAGGGTAVTSAGGVIVHSGDTLSSIAARAGVSTAALASANDITNPNLVTIGQSLRLPSGRSGGSSSASAGSTTVRSGETLSAIAARSGVSITALAQANGIFNPNLVRIGQSLKIPAGGSAATPYRGTSRSEVGNLIAQAAARHGVDASLARAIAWQESGWNQSMRSNVGAIGVMQLMPETASWVGPSLLGRSINANDVRDNVDGGVAFLAWLNRQAGSDHITIAGYYQGLSSVRRIGLYDDTKQYIRSVQALRGRV